MAYAAGSVNLPLFDPCAAGTGDTEAPLRGGHHVPGMVPEGFQRSEVTEAHRLHECPKCRRLLYVSKPGEVATLVRE